MTQSKYTPGPWSYVDRQMETKSAQKIDAFYSIYADPYKSGLGMDNNIARVFKNPGAGHEANARLIAAAPEMFEALEWIADHCDGNMLLPDFVHEAIDKAHGES